MLERQAVGVASLAFVLVTVCWGAGVAVAESDPLFESAAWGVDFVHAGNQTENATYPEVMGSGACVLDYDDDGWQDLFLVNSRYDDDQRQSSIDPRSHLYRNDRGQGFERVDALNVSSWGQGCAVGDYDGDGDEDVAINTWGGPLLYRNDGGGSFTNVTASANVENRWCGEERCFGASIAFLDYDEDADLDLYATNYVAWDGEGPPSPIRYPGQCNVLYENVGDATFEDVTSKAGVADCGNNHLGLAVQDFDDDGWQDIYVANDETRNALYLNNQNGTFDDVREEAQVDDRRGGMGTAGGDFDGDRLPDIVITHYGKERYALFEQDTKGTYDDLASTTGIAEASANETGWGTEFLDYDNDGDLDLAWANGHVSQEYATDSPYGQVNDVLENRDGDFVNVTDRAWSGDPIRNVTRGLATADFDQDGSLDLVTVNNANESAEAFLGTGRTNNWLQLELGGNATVPPSALGATVTVETEARDVEREVVAQASYESQSTRTLHFGLGSATAVQRVVVDWPDGTRQTFEEVQANQRLALGAGQTLETVRERVLARVPEEVPANRTAPVEVTGEALQTSGNASFSWTVGNETVDGATLTREFDELGSYEVTLRVEDAHGADEATTAIRVENLEPTASLDLPDEVLSQTNATLDGTNSTDPDGNVSGWTWTVEGSTLEGSTASYSFAEPGTYEVRLEVTDDAGANASATGTIEVTNREPVADAGDDKLGNVDSVFAFDGTGSSDPDGETASYEWRFGDGATASGAEVNHSYDGVGNYTAELTVTDEAGASSTDTVEVTVDEENAPPVASLGPDREVDRTQPVAFDASDSHDPDGEIASYEWTFGDGANATGTTVEHTYEELGEYTAELTVTDEQGARAAAAVNVTVVNLDPSLSVGEDVEQEGRAPIPFSANASDPDGQIERIEWAFGDGANATGREVTHDFGTYGRYTVDVTARDGDGANATETVDVWLFARPRVNASMDGEATRVDPARFDASEASDPDGEIERIEWAFGDGANATGATVEHTYDELGAYTVNVTVTDDDGFEVSRTRTVEVVNIEPSASVDAADVANLNQSIRLDASKSSDRDGWIVQHEWRTSEGAFLVGERVHHAWTTTGDHEARVTVSDDDGASTSARHELEVTDELTVGASPSASAYGLTDTPRVGVQVDFANGAPVEGASVEATVQYVVDVPEDVGPVSRSGSGESVPSELVLYEYNVTGSADDRGGFAFDVPPVVTGPVPVHTPTGTPAEAWGFYRVLVNATFQGNHGNATTTYQVWAPNGAPSPSLAPVDRWAPGPWSPTVSDAVQHLASSSVARADVRAPTPELPVEGSATVPGVPIAWTGQVK